MAIPHNLLSLLIFVCLGSIAFRSFGLIVAAVVNSSQESNILIQPIYMAMLFSERRDHPDHFHAALAAERHAVHPGDLSHDRASAASCSAAKPLLKTRVRACPHHHGIRRNLYRDEIVSLGEGGKTARLGQALGAGRVAAVLLPRRLSGMESAGPGQSTKSWHAIARGPTWLIQNARIFVGNGKVIESGAVLISRGKIAEVYEGSFPDAKTLNAEPIDAAGKTVLPGLIDMHVHLGVAGGFYDDWSKFDPNKSAERELEHYLYCGVTAVRSAGDASMTC